MTAETTASGDGTGTDGVAEPVDPTGLAEDLLVVVRRGESTREFEARLAALDGATLASGLPDDDAKLVFWIDVYNAYAQLLLDRQPDVYERSRRRFFGQRAIPIAGEWLSLEGLEHGLLRRSQLSFGLGYVPNPFPSSFERRFRVDERDWRIHFALNCGAASCPPIRAYRRDRIDDQLDLATRSYLDSEVVYDAEASVVRVPRLMLWYRGDFGGGDGIRSILREFDCVPADADPKIRCREYDWSKDGDAFAE